jgi:membrane-bound serine protease (ClpP class)
MLWRRLLLLILVTLAGAGAAAAAPGAVVIGLDGPIGAASAAYVVRSLHAAAERDAAAAVLRIDTPGGLDSAMREIVRAILASPVPVLAFVAPSGARAASAGTFILYAAPLAAMAPGTNVGAAAPVSLFAPTALPGPEDKKPAQRDAEMAKIANDAAAYIRGLATLRGRNAEWAERAVREAVSLPYDAALAQHVIDLVANDVPDLLAKADGREVNVLGRTVTLHTRGLPILHIAPDWRDRLLALLTDPSVVYLLLLVGVAGLAFEFSHPGIYAPGVIGAIALLLGGYGLNLLPVDYAGAALALLGLALMAAEAFVPSFGAFVIGGATAFVIGSLLMFETPGLRLPWPVIAAATAFSAALFGAVLRLLLHARRRPVASGARVLIGRVGRTIDWAGHAGNVLVEGERWRASAAQPLLPGQAVRVVGRRGLTLRVEAAPRGEA